MKFLDKIKKNCRKRSHLSAEQAGPKGEKATFGRIVTVDEYVSLRARIIPLMQELHGLGSTNFWAIALYYFVGDTLKAGIENQEKQTIGYDDVAHKELTRWGRAERIHRTAPHNLREIAEEASGLHSQSKPDSVSVPLNSKSQKLAFLLVFMVRYWTRRKNSGHLKRQRLNLLAQKINDEALACALRHMPVHLVEDFDFYRAMKICYLAPLDTRKMKNGLAVSFASLAERGGITRLEQHGGFYGETKSKGTVVETSLPTFYHTWGWAYESHHVPGRAKQLETFARKFSTQTHEGTDLLVILPTYLDEHHGHRLRDIWPELASIARAARLRLVLRHRPRKVEQADQAEQNRLRELLRGTSVTFSEHRSLENALAVTRLSICVSHPATAFLQCLKVSNPVLGFISDRSDYIPQYLGFVTDLEKLGVLHASSDSLLATASKVAGDPAVWWSQVEGDPRMSRYQENFCGSRD